MSMFSFKKTRVRQLWCLLFICVAIVFLFSERVAAEAYDIDDYRVKMIWSDNRSCRVMESVSLHFNEERQGIIRELPHDNDYEKFSIKNINVIGDPYAVESRRGYTDVRIGTAGTYLIGPKSYQLAFTRVYARDDDPEYDWLYVDLIPGNWDADIASASATVVFPAAELLSYTLHFGTVGSVGGDEDLDVVIENNTMTVTAKRSVINGEAITLMAQFPEGTFASAPRAPMDPLFRYELILLIGALLILGVTLFFFWRARSGGVVPTVQFYPPENLNPLEVGYIYDGEVDPVDLSSLVFYWASHGHLAIIEDQNGHCMLQKINDLDGKHMAYERIAFGRLWQSKTSKTEDLTQTTRNTDTLNLDEAKSGAFAGIASAVELKYTDQYALEAKGSRILMRTLKELGAITLSLLLASIVYLFLRDVDSINALIFAALSLLFVRAFIFSLIRSTSMGMKSGLVTKNNAMKILTFLIFIGIFIGFFMPFRDTILGFLNSDMTLHWYIGVAIVLAGLATVILTSNIRKRTAYGEMLYSQIAGFKEFLLLAEKDRLEILIESNPSYFYDILPYAQVLGVSSKWVEKFRYLVIDPPNWYYCHDTFTVDSFYQRYSATNDKINRSMTDSLRSSSPAGGGGGGGFSSGGGSSGGSSGGGGGGGGRSW